MELRVLKYFLAVAREENITRAAALLHVTQPTLSRQLMQLEQELGVKLFHRSRHRIVLTPDGLLLRRRAQEIVDLAGKAERELAGGEAPLSGEIAIGCGETRNMEALARMIASAEPSTGWLGNPCTGISMFDCPEQSHTSPISTSRSVSRSPSLNSIV